HNPTWDAVESKIADLEGGVAALLTSAGQAASMISVMNIAHSGDHVICSASLYGGTYNLFNKTMREMGIDFTFINPDADESEIDQAFRSNTRLVFAETLANPTLVVLDIEKFARVAHRHEVPLIIDNTFPTPINCRPFDFGADIVVHSTSKYMDGHASSVGGVIVDSGNFNWENGKYPELTTPDDSYHGLVYTKAFGKMAYVIKCRAHILRDTGMAASPFNAYLLNMGLETLHLRMERHCSNALTIARHLEQHPAVTWVNYPGLESNKYYELAQKYMPNGTCGVISFGVKGGRNAAETFMRGLKVAAIVTHVADVRTCVLHPANATHRQLSDDQMAQAGLPTDLIRLSVGIEYVGDLIADLDQALAHIN
ncbi:MAG: PLP-dependent transferase, partial [Eubacteriales bacterium]|nr:PLP-dependent transferase [Eubacteriales bacterium]